MAEPGRPRRGRIEKKGTFICEKCNLATPFHAFGRTCSFASSLVLLEEAFIARDPFSARPQPLILGSHCTSCNKVVCVSPVSVACHPQGDMAHGVAYSHQSCSVFYTKRFCIDCVRSNLDEFPKEIQQEVSKSQAN